MRCRIGKAQGVWEEEGTNAGTSKPNLKKGLWSPDEDNQLICYMRRKDLVSCWNDVAKQAGLQRCGKSCRLRWINYLRPGLKRYPISRQEEQLIIKLQSILGNRWSQIAAQLPGRTDNEIKNYWNSSIKRKLRVKPYGSSSTAIAGGDINSKINIPFRSDGICNEFGRISNPDSMPAHVHGRVMSRRSAQPYLGVMPEGCQPHNSTFNVVTTGDNQLCVPGVLELKKEESQGQNHELLIDPNPNKNLLNSYSQLSNNGNLTHTHESFSTNATFMSSSLQEQGLNYYKAVKSATTNELIIESCRTTVATYEGPVSANNCTVDSIRITIPSLAERQLLNQNNENDGKINQNLIMNDYSSLTASSRSSSYGYLATDFADVYPGVSYTSNDHELLSYLDGHKSYQLPYIEGGGDGVGDQLGCSRISHQEANVKPIPAIFGGGTGALQIQECNGVAGEVTGWTHDDMYNISDAAASDFFNDIYVI